VDLIEHYDTFEALENRELLLISRESGFDGPTVSLELPMETLRYISQHESAPKISVKNLSSEEILDEIGKILYNVKHHDSKVEQGIKKVRRLFEYNGQLEFVQNMESFHFTHTSDEEYIVAMFCYVMWNSGEEACTLGDLEDYLERNSLIKLRRERHTLFKKKVLEVVGDGLKSRDDSVQKFRLTADAQKKLCGEFLQKIADKNSRDLKKPESIAEKALFYPRATQEKIDELAGLLSKKNYAAICKRLKKRGQRTGFACLFSGGPGTGKTETALQIARRTGRAIMQVDIAASKSMWYGESEKRVQKIFSDYRQLVAKLPVTPILLFNEADALINKRSENADRSTDKTENSIQNIILQSIEDLDGILIATTNLEKNMDKAFERRFLYKIEFEAPGAEAREQIWHAMLDELSPDTARELAARFEMTGGQIENVARKNTVNQILHGEDALPLERLARLCEAELGTGGRVMGFR
jgi:broad-specificity NMP kinase